MFKTSLEDELFQDRGRGARQGEGSEEADGEERRKPGIQTPKSNRAISKEHSYIRE